MPPARDGRVELGGRYGGTVKRTGAGCGQSRLKAETGVPLVQEFNAATLRFLREAVMAQASAAGLPDERAIDVMLAVHELAANAVRHGAGSGRLRMEVTPGQLCCEVSDAGQGRRAGPGSAAAPWGTAPLATPPWPVEPGHGLWVTREAADQVRVVSGPGGSVVTAVFRLG